MPVAAGDYFTGAIIRQLKKGTSDATIVKGQVMNVVSNLWTGTAAAAGAKGPFAVCARTPATADSTVDAITRGIVYVTAGGVINPGSFVMNDPNTIGQVIAYTATVIATPQQLADVQNARDEFKLIVGVYEGHENENSLNNPPTAAASTDVIRIHLNSPF